MILSATVAPALTLSRAHVSPEGSAESTHMVPVLQELTACRWKGQNHEQIHVKKKSRCYRAMKQGTGGGRAWSPKLGVKGLPGHICALSRRTRGTSPALSANSVLGGSSKAQRLGVRTEFDERGGEKKASVARVSWGGEK